MSGPLIDYQGSKSGANISAMIGSGTVISADYLTHATFGKGAAEIQIGLLKVDGVWQINSFRVNSPMLITNAAGRKT